VYIHFSGLRIFLVRGGGDKVTKYVDSIKIDKRIGELNWSQAFETVGATLEEAC
jgi:hypothetical protein